MTHFSHRWALPIIASLVYACASPSGMQTTDSLESLLEAPVDQVRAAVIDVFTSQGYAVESSRPESENQTESIHTGYREEIRSPWDWMLRFRFGIGRTQAEANLNREGEGSTKLILRVLHESKAALVESWTQSDPPIPQSAENYLRLIKNHLKLL
jgi:hypothetical protein